MVKRLAKAMMSRLLHKLCNWCKNINQSMQIFVINYYNVLQTTHFLSFSKNFVDIFRDLLWNNRDHGITIALFNKCRYYIGSHVS